MKRLIGILIILTIFSGLASAQGPTTNLEMEVLQTEPVPLQAGEYADVWIRVTNTGNAEASNPTFEVVDEFPYQATDKSEWSPRGGLQPGESYDMRVQVKVNENAVFGNNSLKIRKSSNNETFITEQIPLEVRTDDRSLVVSDLSFPDRVEPGSSSKMNITLENQANSNFRNIDVSLNVDELPVAPQETSRKRISSVGPEESETASFTLNVDQDAENQLYQLPIEITYQNQAGQEFTTTQTTGVSVGGYPNIDVAIDESDIRSAGRGTVTLRILNRGEGQARFAEVGLQESDQYEILSQDSIYLGTMIADDYQTAEFDLYVEEGETLELPVTVDYRTGEGDQTESFTVEREMYSSSELQRYTGGNGGLPIVPIVVVLALVGGVYFWRKRRKKE
ncbi:MAG: hypothetical protein R6V35_00790 [Candidatus Nanohaloarchaea archaeon]